MTVDRPVFKKTQDEPEQVIDSVMFERPNGGFGPADKSARSSEIVSQTDDQVIMQDNRVFSRQQDGNWKVDIPGHESATVSNLRVSQGKLSYQVGNLQAVETAEGVKTVVNLASGRTTVFSPGGKIVHDSDLRGGAPAPFGGQMAAMGGDGRAPRGGQAGGGFDQPAGGFVGQRGAGRFGADGRNAPPKVQVDRTGMSQRFDGGNGMEPNFARFDANWRAAGLNVIDTMKVRENQLWNLPQPPLAVDQSPTLDIARQIHGDNFAGLYQMGRNPADPMHSINNYFARRYFAAKDRGDNNEAQAAMEMLAREVESNRNPSALSVFQSLKFIDAISDLSNARDDASKLDALKRLALLEDSNPHAKKALDELPKVQDPNDQADLAKQINQVRAEVGKEKLDAATRKNDLGGQQQALRKLAELEGTTPAARGALKDFEGDNSDRKLQTKYARIAAAGGDEGLKRASGEQLDRLLDPKASPRDLAREIEIAKETLKPEERQGAEKALGLLKALEMSHKLNEVLEDPAKADKTIGDLLELSESNKDAKRVLEAIGVKDTADKDALVKQLTDPEQRSKTAADIRQKLAPIEEEAKDIPRFRLFKGMKPEDLMNQWPDKKQVDEARKAAQEYARKNWQLADDQLAVFLDRESTPEARQKSMEELRTLSQDRLRKLGRNSFQPVADFAEAAETAFHFRDLSQAKDTPPEKLAETLKTLKEMSNRSEPAKQMIAQIMTGENKSFEDVIKALRSGDSGLKERVSATLLNEVDKTASQLRVSRIVRDLHPESTHEDWKRAADALALEVKAGNKLAADWHQWTGAQDVMTGLNADLKDPAKVKEAITKLADMAEGKDSKPNPYARYALASLVLSANGQSNINSWLRAGNGALNEKPMYTADLSTALKDNPQLLESIQTQALKAFDTQLQRDSRPLEKGEAQALALAFANISTLPKSETTDKLSRDIESLLSKAVTSTEKDGVNYDGTDKIKPTAQSFAALDGIFEAIQACNTGSEALADIYLKGANHPNFAKQFESIRSWGRGGDLASMRVLSGVAAGLTENKKFSEQAVWDLQIAGADDQTRPQAIKAMLHGFDKYGDSFQLLSSMGKIAAREEVVPAEVRAAMSKGLADKKSHNSAVDGLFGYAEKWTKQDADNIMRFASKEMIAATGQHLERIPNQIVLDVLKDATARVESRSTTAVQDSEKVSAEKIAALKTMGAMSKYVTAQQVLAVGQYGNPEGPNQTDPRFKSALGRDGLQKLGLSAEHAKSVQDEAAKTLLGIMGKAAQRDANTAAFESFGNLKWPGVINDDLRKVVIDYAKGDLRNLELLDQVQKLIYDANIPMPTASIMRHLAPGMADEQYFQRAKEAAEHYSKDGANGELVIRDVAARIAMWNSLETLRRRELTGTDALRTEAIDFTGKTLDARTINALPPHVREKLIGTSAPLGPENPMPPNFKDKTLDAATFNALPSALRKQLTGTDIEIDTAQVEGQLFNGTLQNTYPFLLEGPPAGRTIESRLKEQIDYYVKDAGRIARIGEDLRREERGRIALEGEALNRSKDRAVTDLVDHAKAGVGIGNRLGSLYKYTSPLGTFMPDPVDEWAQEQSGKVHAIRDIERKIEANSQTQQIANNIRDMLSFAEDIRRYEQLVNDGKRKEADLAAIDYLDKYGIDVMSQFAPRIYKELTEATGPGNFGRSGFERLSDNKITRSFETFPKFNSNPKERFYEGIAALKQIKSGMYGADVDAVRSSALRGIESDPKLSALSEVSKKINTNLSVLQKMSEAAQSGTKYETFVQDAKTRAKELQEAFKEADQNGAVDSVRQRVNELTTALKDIQDPLARKNIQDKINSMNDMIKILDPNSPGRQQLDNLFKSIESRDFNESTMLNWLKENAVVLGVTIAATAICVVSMGAATPLAVILVSSAVALAATEITKEGLYLINHHWGDTGLGKYEERSHGGKWAAKEWPAWKKFYNSLGDKDAASTALELANLLDKSYTSFNAEVMTPLTKEYLMNVAIGVATMGIARFGSESFKSAVNPKEFAKFLLTKPASQLSNGLQQAAGLAKNNPGIAGRMGDWLGKVGREGVTNSGFTAAQEGLQGAAGDLNRSLGRQNMYVAFVISAGLAFAQAKAGKAGAMRFGKGNEVHVDPAMVNDLIRTCKDQGHGVKALPDGSFEVRTYNAPHGELPIIVRPTPDVAVALPKHGTETAPKKSSGLPAAENKWLSTAAKEFAQPSNGDYHSAYDAAGNHPNLPKDLNVTFVDVPVSAKDLKANLADHLKNMQVGEATPGQGDRFGVSEPRTVIKLESGAQVDLISRPGEARTIDGRPLSAADAAEITALRNSPEGQRAIAEHAAIKLEELIHIRQMQNGGKPISDTYQQYLKHFGEKPPGPDASIGELRRQAELDVVAAMYDGGMPLEALQRHFENSYLDRKDLMNYLRQREAGKLPPEGEHRPTSRPGSDVITPPAQQRPATSFGSQNPLEPHRANIDAFGDQLKAKMPAERAAKIMDTIQAELRRSNPEKLAENIRMLDELPKRADFLERMQAIESINQHAALADLHPGLEAFFHERTTPQNIKALEKVLDLPEMKALVASNDAVAIAEAKANLKFAIRDSKFPDRVAAVEQLSRKSGFADLNFPAADLFSGQITLERLNQLSTAVDSPAFKQLIADPTMADAARLMVRDGVFAESFSDPAKAKSVTDLMAKKHSEGKLAEFAQDVRDYNSKFLPLSKEFSYRKTIMEHVLNGAPVDLGKVKNLTESSTLALKGVLEVRSLVDKALASGNLDAFPNMSKDQLAHALKQIDGVLTSDMARSKFAAKIDELCGAAFALKKNLPYEQKQAKLDSASSDTVTTKDRPVSEELIAKLKKKVAGDPEAENAINRLLKASAPIELINVDTKGLLKGDGPVELLKVRDQIEAGLKNGTLPDHLSQKQWTDIVSSIDSLMKGQGVVEGMRNRSRRQDDCAKGWQAQTAESCRVLRELFKTPGTAADKQRMSNVADILGVQGKLPIEIPFERLMNPAVPSEHLQLVRDTVTKLSQIDVPTQAGPHKDAWDAGFEISQVLATTKDPVLADCIFIPSEPGARMDRASMDGLLLNLKDGSVRPIDFSTEQAQGGYGKMDPRSPFDFFLKNANDKKIKWATEGEAALKDFLSRPGEAAIPKDVWMKLKDSPVGFPLAPNKESLLTLGEQTANTRQYMENLHAMVNEFTTAGKPIPAWLRKHTQSCEGLMATLETQHKIVSSAPELLQQSVKVSDDGHKLAVTLEAPITITPNVNQVVKTSPPRTAVVQKLEIDTRGILSAKLKDGSSIELGNWSDLQKSLRTSLANETNPQKAEALRTNLELIERRAKNLMH